MSNAKTTRKRFALALLGAVGALCLALMMANAPKAGAQARLMSDTVWAPSILNPGQHAFLGVVLDNAGDSAGGGEDLTIELPAGITYDGTVSVSVQKAGPFTKATCSGAGTSVISCTTPSGDGNTKTAMPIFGIDIPADAQLGVYQVRTIRPGDPSGQNVEVKNMRIGHGETPFGMDADNLLAGAFDDSTYEATGSLHHSGADYLQAGGHPYDASASNRLNLPRRNTFENFKNCYQFGEGIGASGGCLPEDKALSEIVATLPPGFVGDTTAVARCTDAQFPLSCPPESQIGVITLYVPALPVQASMGVFNMQPPPGQPAQFAFEVIWSGRQNINPTVRADGDYGITMTAPAISEGGIITRSKVSIWGNPADPRHDQQRCEKLNSASLKCTGGVEEGFSISGGWNPGLPSSSNLPERAFLSMPTNCADTPSTSIYTGVWENRPVLDDLSDPRWTKTTLDHPDHTGCEAVPFTPTIDFETASKQADSPTGLGVHLHIPRENDSNPDGIIQSHLRKATVRLPDGVAFNASAADGLQACSTDQIGLVSAPGETPYRFNNEEPVCPPASKVADAVITTPVLDEQLTGELFLAAQDDNPFDSTFAVYIVVREPSILVKLPGKVELDQNSGQITTTFDHNPQLPFSDLELDFFGGPRASLATPQTCGTFTTHSQFVPWSAKDPANPTDQEIVFNSDPLSIDSAPNGQGCASAKSQLPLNAGLTAGSRNPIGGAHSPFEIQITRPDGSQELDKLEISPPPGFVASLKGIPYCSEAQIAATASRDSGKAEQASSTCPAASQVGTTNVGAGAGSNPFYAQGKLYLAGPYKGETLSVVSVTPAVAGPFDLGNVVVRSALKINPLTARITAVTDPLPRTIEGVPLRIKDVRIALDRPNWAINPTNCEAMSVDVTAFGVDGAIAKPSNRYQLRDCERLGFKPKLSIHLKGGTKRGDHPSLLAVLKTRPGDANIARAAVTLPSSAFLDQAHIRTICTRVQYAADTCPKGAVYGYAKAETPLLDNPIEGNVILRSSDNKLPDLVGRLRGVANIEAVGRIDSIKGGIRNSFDVIPDAPFDTFTLRMQGGKKGLVINSKNLCATTNRATVKFTAQNGRTFNYRPVVVADGCGKKAKRGGKGKRGKGKR